MTRTAFLASLVPGTMVHLVLSDDLRSDVVVVDRSARRIVVRGDGRDTVLDGYGYRGKSLVCRIEPALVGGAPGSAVVWNAAYAELSAAYTARLAAR